MYSLTSPYGHLYDTDSLFGPRNAKNHTFPTSIIRHLCKADAWFGPFGDCTSINFLEKAGVPLVLQKLFWPRLFNLGYHYPSDKSLSSISILGKLCCPVDKDLSSG